MKAHRFVCGLSAGAMLSLAHAGTIQDNLNRSTTLPAAAPLDATCQKWTASPIQITGDGVTVDAGKLALELVANAVSSYSGGNSASIDPRVCKPRTPAGRL